MTEDIFINGIGDELRRRAEVICLRNDLRLAPDNQIYNSFGTAVARYLGTDGKGGIKFVNLKVETDFEKSKILQRGET